MFYTLAFAVSNLGDEGCDLEWKSGKPFHVKMLIFIKTEFQTQYTTVLAFGFH